MFHCLYKTINSITSKYYIGVHSTENIEDGYLGSGKILKRSLNKYGKENHIREIINLYETREALLLAEIKIIKDLDLLNDSLCMNIMPGGSGGSPKGKLANFFGKKHSEESKKKMSENRSGILHSSETKQKISNSNKGKKLGWAGKRNQEFKNLLSEKKKDFYAKNPDMLEQCKGFLGRSHSRESKTKTSEALKGDKNHNSKRVYLDGIEYCSITEAMSSTKLSRYKIKSHKTYLEL